AAHRAGVRRPGPHHGHARRPEDPAADGRTALAVQPDRRAHQPDQADDDLRWTRQWTGGGRPVEDAGTGPPHGRGCGPPGRASPQPSTAVPPAPTRRDLHPYRFSTASTPATTMTGKTSHGIKVNRRGVDDGRNRPTAVADGPAARRLVDPPPPAGRDGLDSTSYSATVGGAVARAGHHTVAGRGARTRGRRIPATGDV